MMTHSALARAARGTRPGSFAMVMATGIVSIALRGAGPLTFAAMIVTALIRARSGTPGNLYRGTIFMGRHSQVPTRRSGVIQVYMFQAMITLEPPAPGRPATLPSGRMCRMTLCAQHSQTGASKFFSAMVANSGESTPGQADDHVIATISIPGPDAAEYFGTGAEFTVWLGGDIARGVVTRRKIVWPLTA